MPSENVYTSVEPVVESTDDVVVDDRRSRKREDRRLRLLEIAAEIVDDQGVDGMTMAALVGASEYAAEDLYTYFSSRSALVAALQQWALEILGEVALQAVAKWDQDLAEDSQLDERVKALARLCAFSDLFLAAPVAHRREFRLQQELLITPGVQDVGDAGSVVPIAMTVLAVPQGLLAHAARVGALNNHGGALDLAGVPLEVALNRILGSRPELKYHEAGMDLNLSDDIKESFCMFQKLIYDEYKRISPQYSFIEINATQAPEEQQQLMRSIIHKKINFDNYKWSNNTKPHSEGGE